MSDNVISNGQHEAWVDELPDQDGTAFQAICPDCQFLGEIHHADQFQDGCQHHAPGECYEPECLPADQAHDAAAREAAKHRSLENQA